MRDILDTAIQQEKWSCGPAAIVNAVAVMGVVCNEKDFRRYVTPERGMNEDQMIKALMTLDLGPVERVVSNEDAAWRQLISELPAIICVDRCAHWVAATRLVAGDMIEIRDPAAGTLVYDQETLTRRWRYLGHFYFITIRPT